MFSDAALVVLDEQQYDPIAKGQYEIMSGGLVWRDDFPEMGSPEWKLIARSFFYRYLIAFRADLTLGKERVEFRPLWEQVEMHAPNWPGLRPERRGEKVRRRLLAAKRRSDVCLDELERRLAETEPKEE
ncbi:MAG: hypothetical protein K8U57_39935 [Planctomycetes bacterium]|nr:hypothetical protein [Planctomycetota bacterium]